MARRSNGISGKDIAALIALIAAIIGVIVKFLVEVNKRGMWMECIISSAIFAGINYVTYLLQDAKIVNSDCFLVVIFISVIAYCTYWGIQFSKGSEGYLSKHRIEENSMYWQEADWWWTLDGWQFEREVAKIFQKQGYKVELTKGSGDGGVDIILKNGGYTAIVQCKHYRNPVPPEPIRALWGCKDDFGADEVILIASSGITESGASFIQNKPNFRVLNLNDIMTMSKSPQIEEETENVPKETKTTIETKTTGKNTVKTTNTRIGRRIDI